jgi:hypothetical protein
VHDNPYSIEQARVNGWEDGWQAADELLTGDEPLHTDPDRERFGSDHGL